MTVQFLSSGWIKSKQKFSLRSDQPKNGSRSNYFMSILETHANYVPLRFDLVRTEGFCSCRCLCLPEFEQPTTLLFVAGREGLDARNDLCSGLRFRVLGFSFERPDFVFLRPPLPCGPVALRSSGSFFEPRLCAVGGSLRSFASLNPNVSSRLLLIGALVDVSENNRSWESTSENNRSWFHSRMSETSNQVLQCGCIHLRMDFWALRCHSVSCVITWTNTYSAA